MTAIGFDFGRAGTVECLDVLANRMIGINKDTYRSRKQGEHMWRWLVGKSYFVALRYIDINPFFQRIRMQRFLTDI